MSLRLSVGTKHSFETAPLVAPVAPIEFTIEQFPTPRFWFEAADGITLIQLQKNAFIFNWRKRDNDYPHFEAVKAAFAGQCLPSAV
jgi:hypothetical protein